jgi:hypothetical protein
LSASGKNDKPESLVFIKSEKSFWDKRQPLPAMENSVAQPGVWIILRLNHH